MDIPDILKCRICLLIAKKAVLLSCCEKIACFYCSANEIVRKKCCPFEDCKKFVRITELKPYKVIRDLVELYKPENYVLFQKNTCLETILKELNSRRTAESCQNGLLSGSKDKHVAQEESNNSDKVVSGPLNTELGIASHQSKQLNSIVLVPTSKDSTKKPCSSEFSFNCKQNEQPSIIESTENSETSLVAVSSATGESSSTRDLSTGKSSSQLFSSVKPLTKAIPIQFPKDYSNKDISKYYDASNPLKTAAKTKPKQCIPAVNSSKQMHPNAGTPSMKQIDGKLRKKKNAQTVRPNQDQNRTIIVDDESDNDDILQKKNAVVKQPEVITIDDDNDEQFQRESDESTHMSQLQYDQESDKYTQLRSSIIAIRNNMTEEGFASLPSRHKPVLSELLGDEGLEDGELVDLPAIKQKVKKAEQLQMALLTCIHTLYRNEPGVLEQTFMSPKLAWSSAMLEKVPNSDLLILRAAFDYTIQLIPTNVEERFTIGVSAEVDAGIIISTAPSSLSNKIQAKLNLQGAEFYTVKNLVEEEVEPSGEKLYLVTIDRLQGKLTRSVLKIKKGSVVGYGLKRRRCRSSVPATATTKSVHLLKQLQTINSGEIAVVVGTVIRTKQFGVVMPAFPLVQIKLLLADVELQQSVLTMQSKSRVFMQLKNTGKKTLNLEKCICGTAILITNPSMEQQIQSGRILSTNQNKENVKCFESSNQSEKSELRSSNKSRNVGLQFTNQKEDGDELSTNQNDMVDNPSSNHTEESYLPATKETEEVQIQSNANTMEHPPPATKETEEVQIQSNTNTMEHPPPATSPGNGKDTSGESTQKIRKRSRWAVKRVHSQLEEEDRLGGTDTHLGAGDTTAPQEGVKGSAEGSPALKIPRRFVLGAKTLETKRSAAVDTTLEEGELESTVHKKSLSEPGNPGVLSPTELRSLGYLFLESETVTDGQFTQFTQLGLLLTVAGLTTRFETKIRLKYKNLYDKYKQRVDLNKCLRQDEADTEEEEALRKMFHELRTHLKGQRAVLFTNSQGSVDLLKTKSLPEDFALISGVVYLRDFLVKHKIPSQLKITLEEDVDTEDVYRSIMKSSYPVQPPSCGQIAKYTLDLVQAIRSKFSYSSSIQEMITDCQQTVSNRPKLCIKDRAEDDQSIKEVEIQYSYKPSTPEIVALQYVDCVDILDDEPYTPQIKEESGVIVRNPVTSAEGSTRSVIKPTEKYDVVTVQAVAMEGGESYSLVAEIQGEDQEIARIGNTVNFSPNLRITWDFHSEQCLEVHCGRFIILTAKSHHFYLCKIFEKIGHCSVIPGQVRRPALHIFRPLHLHWPDQVVINQWPVSVCLYADVPFGTAARFLLQNNLNMVFDNNEISMEGVSLHTNNLFYFQLQSKMLDRYLKMQPLRTGTVVGSVKYIGGSEFIQGLLLKGGIKSAWKP